MGIINYPVVSWFNGIDYTFHLASLCLEAPRKDFVWGVLQENNTMICLYM